MGHQGSRVKADMFSMKVAKGGKILRHQFRFSPLILSPLQTSTTHSLTGVTRYIKPDRLLLSAIQNHRRETGSLHPVSQDRREMNFQSVDRMLQQFQLLDTKFIQRERERNSQSSTKPKEFTCKPFHWWSCSSDSSAGQIHHTRACSEVSPAVISPF